MRLATARRIAPQFRGLGGGREPPRLMSSNARIPWPIMRTRFQSRSFASSPMTIRVSTPRRRSEHGETIESCAPTIPSASTQRRSARANRSSSMAIASTEIDPLAIRTRSGSAWSSPRRRSGERRFGGSGHRDHVILLACPEPGAAFKEGDIRYDVETEEVTTEDEATSGGVMTEHLGATRRRSAIASTQPTRHEQARRRRRLNRGR